MNNKQKYYALYDTQLGEYKHNITGETISEVAEDGANWWYDINYDSEIEDLLDRYESDENYINELYNVSSYEEFEEKQMKELREMDNVEYLEDKGFEIVKITALEYEVLNDEETLENPSDYELERLCKNYNTKVYKNNLNK